MRAAFLIYLFVSLISINSYAQKSYEPKSELAKIQQAYSQYKSISFKVDVYGYKNAYDKKPELLGNGISSKSTTFNYSAFTGAEFLQRNKFGIYVNHQQKIIDCYDYPETKKPKEKMPIDFSSLLDSICSKFDSTFLYKGIKDGLKCFIMKSPKAEITQTELYFNAKTNFLEKVVYYYNNSKDLDYQPEFSSVMLKYNNYVYSVNETACNYSADKYVIKQKNGYKPSEAYKGYRVQYHDLRGKKLQ